MTELTARERHRAEVWARDENVCALRPEATRYPRDDSEAGLCGEPHTPDGRLEADHILKVSALLRRRAELVVRADRSHDLSIGQRAFIGLAVDELVADARNGWILCGRHHRMKDGRRLVIVEEILLPMDFVDFVVDYELGDFAGRELRPRPVPGSAHAPGALRSRLAPPGRG